MKPKDRRAIRRGRLRFFTHATSFGHYYSTGIETDGRVQLLHVPRKGGCKWISVPEAYFRAEFWQPDGVVRIPRF